MAELECFILINAPIPGPGFASISER